MPEIKTQKIFFSYARADAEEFALKLATALRNDGANVWIDQLDIKGGENSTIKFVANNEGIFTYYCIYHQPTMTGKLVVLP